MEKKKTKVGLFLQKVVKAVPGIATDVLEIATSGNVPGAILGKVGDLLKSKAVKEEEAKILLEELEQNKRDFELEMYRMDIEAYNIQMKDVSSAREMYKTTQNEATNEIGRTIMKRNLTYVFLLVLLEIVAIIGCVLLMINNIVNLEVAVSVGSSITGAIGTVCGMVIQNLLQERQQVVGFHYGSAAPGNSTNKEA